jgi:hypothetical protein
VFAAAALLCANDVSSWIGCIRSVRTRRYVNLDDGVVLPERNSDGTLAVDPERFPSGMASLAEQAHRRGLLLGVCESLRVGA